MINYRISSLRVTKLEGEKEDKCPCVVEILLKGTPMATLEASTMIEVGALRSGWANMQISIGNGLLY